MKITILILLLSGFLTAATAQNCDIAQTGVAVFDEGNSHPISAIGLGEHANFKFSIGNFGSALDCSIPANSTRVNFSFPLLPGNVRPYIYDGPLTFSSGYFDWTYDPATEILSGVNGLSIPNGVGDNEVMVKIKGTAAGSGISNLNLLPGSGIQDNDANNFSAAQLIVVASPVPVKLLNFKAVADKCDAMLTWSTESEYNFSHFDLEYSFDARTYVKIGSVPGKGIVTGSNYSFVYPQLNGKGYYRLKMVDMDGRLQVSNIAPATTNCTDKPQVVIYPNPVKFDQPLIVNITGYSGSIKGSLYDAAGRIIKTYTLLINSNSLSVTDLPAGTYMLKIENEGQKAGVFKVVVTR